MRLSFLAAIGLLAPASGLAAQAPRPQDRLPNIVHIIADDVGWDDLGCFGAKDIATPNLDRLAAEGVRMTSFYAPHSTCTATRAALMTGCYAQRVSLPTVLFPNSKQGLHADEVTIAELLQQRGYATALFGKWHLGHLDPFLPTRHGFDAFYGIPYPNDHVPERLDKEGRTRGFPPMPLYEQERIVEQPAQMATLPDRFTERAVQFIAQHKDKPFYLQYSNIETHTPWLTSRRFHHQSKAGVYGDAVQCLDWSVGRILDALDQHGLGGDTLVVFQSDNGPLVHEYPELERIYGHAAAVDTERPHALREGKYQSRFEGGTRVAGLARWPRRIPAGSTTDAMIAGFDWYPTFAGVAGAPLPKDRVLDGMDVISLLDPTMSPQAPAREVLWFHEGFRLVAVRWKDWKYVLPPGPKGKPQLFDLAKDLGETRDVLAQHPDVVATLEKLVAEARADLGDGPDASGTRRRPAGRVE